MVNFAKIRYINDGSGLLLRGTLANPLQLKRRELAPVDCCVIELFGKYQEGYTEGAEPKRNSRNGTSKWKDMDIKFVISDLHCRLQTRST